MQYNTPYRLLLFIFTMIILSSCDKMNRAAASLETAATPMDALEQGNARFVSMHPSHPHETKQRMLDISSAQHPFAVVICCSDSRVPPELIFDQGLGDLFVVRTAGNLMGGLEIGSVEYAVEHLGVKQVVVMGHQQCGAIKAFLQGGEAPGHIKDIVDSIRSEQEIRQIPADDANLLDDCIKANILHGIHQLKQQSPLLAEKIEKNEIAIKGVCYDLHTGQVFRVNDNPEKQ